MNRHVDLALPMPGVRRSGSLPRIAGALGLVLACQAMWAQDIIDPTRPPQLANAAGDVGDNGTGLQSVFISDTRKAAVIGGQLVELGQKYGDATLVRVAESEVTLARGREMEVMHLFPGIDKKMLTAPPKPAAPAAPRKKAKTQGKR
jgi:MSHA biogenesis protein MshK